MLKTFLLVFLFVPWLANAAALSPITHGFTPTPVPHQLPPQALNNLATATSPANTVGCPSGDCTETRISAPSDLPDPAPTSVEPAAGDTKSNFCKDINITENRDLCLH